MSQNDLLDARRNGQTVVTVPNPEVQPKAEHRRFSPEYKKRVLDEAATCTARGELGALLRREGLYSLLLTQWRRPQAQGALAGLAPKKRGPKPDPKPKKLPGSGGRTSACRNA